MLELLLTGDHPALPLLRAQLDRATVTSREFTGVGFFTELEVPEDVPRAPLGERVVFDGGPGEGVGAEFEGLAHGAGFIVFIEQGRLKMLEGFTYDEPWPPESTRWTIRRVPVTRIPPDVGSLD